MFQLEITIQGLPKTTNANARRHWRALQNESKKWQKTTILAIGSARPQEPLKRAHITYTRYSSQRPDHDGLVSSWKHIQDGLIKAGVIVDDKYDNIGEPKYLWEKAPIKKGYITIKIQELIDDSLSPSSPL